VALPRSALDCFTRDVPSIAKELKLPTFEPGSQLAWPPSPRFERAFLVVRVLAIAGGEEGKHGAFKMLRQPKLWRVPHWTGANDHQRHR
jgi:hypothetical protein